MAAMGPGMAIFTRYSKVLDAEGNALKVGDALNLIFQSLDEALAEQEGDFDADSRWALVWFEHYGFAEGEYGVAEQLSKSKNTSGRRNGRGRYPSVEEWARSVAQTRRAA
jgi:putative DNA methylase